ncbi:hypothetical protein EST38_g10578 [Candolleomyces aberdarensis]|uniref:Uncharacterized protein n=1 Tax=Candolleomyces aberdarensis TaxID=2316362 RepID=A0A4Q2D9G3_9AGAR|nr:hypothetical protein EST38_g10578 [Candolleomyces aberdarensis]
MPPEPTKSKSKHFSSRKKLDERRYDAHASELETKRSRGKFSYCAQTETQVRQADTMPIVPGMSSFSAALAFVALTPAGCKRRRCATLCPNGSLSTGHRFVEHLDYKISTLTGRIRQLEDALSTLQAKQSTEPHPLLAADLVSSEDKPNVDDDSKVRGETIEGESSKKVGSGQASSSGANSGEVTDTLGALSIPRPENLSSSNQEPSDFDLIASESPSFSSPPAERCPAGAHTLDLSATRSPARIGDFSLFPLAFPFTPLGQPAGIQAMS